MIYNDLNIVVEPDYVECIANEDESEEYFCMVYDINDIEHKYCLLGFNIMQGFEFEENSIKCIEETIQRMTEENTADIELSRLRLKFDRQSELFNNALGYFSELAKDEELYNILTKSLGMTEDEIEEYGIDYLTNDMEEEQGMTMM